MGVALNVEDGLEDQQAEAVGGGLVDGGQGGQMARGDWGGPGLGSLEMRAGAGFLSGVGSPCLQDHPWWLLLFQQIQQQGPPEDCCDDCQLSLPMEFSQDPPMIHQSSLRLLLVPQVLPGTQLMMRG